MPAVIIPLHVTEHNNVIPLTVTGEEAVIPLTVDCSGGGGEYPYYHGPTIVTPRIRESVELETRNKVVTSDIVVNEIPYFETSNPKGITVIIGG